MEDFKYLKSLVPAKVRPIKFGMAGCGEDSIISASGCEADQGYHVLSGRMVRQLTVDWLFNLTPWLQTNTLMIWALPIGKR